MDLYALASVIRVGRGGKRELQFGVNGRHTLRTGTISKEQIKDPLGRLYLLYHELRTADSHYSYVLNTEMFKKHVDLFDQLSEKENAVLWPEVTFDDGHISNYEYALPILQSRNMKARFFITVGWTGNRSGFMGWAELRRLHEAGQSIGAHGWTHTLLTHCTAKQLETELGSARLMLEDKLGTAITTMSLPGGRYNRRVLSACEEAGYTEVYTSIPRQEVVPLGPLIGRMNIRGDMTLKWIMSLFEPDSKVLSSLGRQYQLKATAKMLLGDRVYEKLWAVLNRKEQESGDSRYDAV